MIEHDVQLSMESPLLSASTPSEFHDAVASATHSADFPTEATIAIASQLAPDENLAGMLYV